MASSPASPIVVSSVSDRYEIRLDVPADPNSEGVAEEFAGNLDELLQAQRMTPIVSSRSCPERIYVQVCRALVSESRGPTYEPVIRMLSKIGGSKKGCCAEIATDEVPSQPDDWQGFRIWMQFTREDFDRLFQHKMPRRRFSLSLARRLTAS